MDEYEDWPYMAQGRAPPLRISTGSRRVGRVPPKVGVGSKADSILKASKEVQTEVAWYAPSNSKGSRRSWTAQLLAEKLFDAIHGEKPVEVSPLRARGANRRLLLQRSARRPSASTPTTPHEAWQNRVGEFGRHVVAASGCPTLAEKGYEQVGGLRALGRVDVLGPSVRICSVCRTRASYNEPIGGHCARVLAAFIAKLWWQPISTQWKLYGNVAENLRKSQN